MPQKKYLFSLVFLAFFLSSAHAEEQEVQAENTEVAVQEEAVSEPEEKESEPAPAQDKNAIRTITTQRSGNNLDIIIQCTKPPVHSISKLLNQTGFFVDIAAAEMNNPADLALPKELDITLSAKTVQSNAPETLEAVRLEFVLPKVYEYSDQVQENNVLVVIEKFYPPVASEQGPVNTPLLNIPLAEVPQEKKTANTLASHLPQIDPLKGVGASIPAAGSGIPPMPMSSFDGYSDENLISIDFFKTDLHNVFRILKDTSDANLVITEGISGNLTLSLKDVPWDFALDIILNLKDLAMEKRHNTIVIYPKNREFKWPKRAAESSLNIEQTGRGPSTIVIKPGDMSQAPEVTEAKKMVAQAIRLEKSGNLEQAVTLYEKAFHEWPKNSEKAVLANKITTIYLARLNQNAKAVYFAKQALSLDKKNTEAALNAAIGLANMGESGQAQQYFDQSVSMGKPSQEALMNYAIFSERHQQYDAALRLLQKYEELYGESLDSMISRARILDQQGRRGEADQVYNAILHAGFQVPPDLRAFIMGRIRSSHVR